ncbi:MAG: flippase-like domain-containing protein [Clostridiales bacterium]|nr:flippase-like domain-containing protein [Clostridiales bacterium]
MLEVEKLEKAKKKRKKILTTVLFLLANALVVLIIILMEDHSGKREPWYIVKDYFSANWYFIVAAFLMFFVTIIGDSAVFFTLTKRMEMKNYLAPCIKVSILGRYYDKVTPWATGGEPFQLAYLIKNNMKATDACAVTMSRHIIRFFVMAPVVITILLASRVTTDIWIIIIAILGVLGGLIVPTFMLICVWKPKLGHAIAKGVISLLYKLKIVKDYDKHLQKVKAGVDNFLSGLEYLSANKKVIIVIGLVALIEFFANNSIPFLVMKGLGIQLDYWTVFVLCVFVSYASSIAPTPGGAGLAELSFYAIFAKYIEGDLLFWAVLFWRLAIYYMPIFIGFTLQLFEGGKEIIKAKKMQ